MSKEEKAAEMARRKEERKQVGFRSLHKLPANDNLVISVVYCLEDCTAERAEEKRRWCKDIVILLRRGNHHEIPTISVDGSNCFLLRVLLLCVSRDY